MVIEVISKVELIKDAELPKEVEFVVVTYGTFDLDEDKAYCFKTYEDALNFYNEVSNKLPTEMKIFIEVFGKEDLETIELFKNYIVTETRKVGA